MRYCVLIFIATVLAGSLALPQTSTTTSANKQTTKKATTKTVSSRTSAASKKGPASKKGKSSKKTVAAYRQTAPTPERYKEIQQALVDKGYLKSEPNGVWDAQSSDALKQFQTDHKLSPTGKLSSASLISLGLGPKTAPAPEPQATINGTPNAPPPSPANY